MSLASPLAVITPPDTEPSVTRESLGEFILSEIIRCSGEQLYCPAQEQILDGFWSRFGVTGMDIARRAFGVHNGVWRNAPVTIRRFSESSDPYFAIPLQAESGDAGNDTR